jgi:hypothetical protein
MLIQPAGEHTSLSMGKWYFIGNAHALNEPNLRKNSKTTVPKIQTVKLPEKKIKIKNPKTFKKKMSRQSRTSIARQPKTQNNPKFPKISSPPQISSRPLWRTFRLWPWARMRESLSASRPRLPYTSRPIHPGHLSQATKFPQWGLIVVAPDSIGVVNAVQRPARTHVSPVPFHNGLVQRVTFIILDGLRFWPAEKGRHRIPGC